MALLILHILRRLQHIHLGDTIHSLIGKIIRECRIQLRILLIELTVARWARPLVVIVPLGPAVSVPGFRRHVGLDARRTRGFARAQFKVLAYG